MADTQPFRAPRLGIGMVFSPALWPFLQRRPDALDMLEIEPQTLWIADDPFHGPFFEFEPGIDLFAAFTGHKLVHSVGMPLGGTRAPHPAQMQLIRKTADRLNSPWVSEHLSIAGTPHRAAGFLLPPLQTDESIRIASNNIKAFRQGVGRPIAVETGVAYFKRKPFEIPDGVFLAQVVEEADCGILLDLHNLYCNHRNGRLKLDDFLSQIPLDRVWEVHLAGGMEADGYWLDSHSGAMPEDLAVIARDVLAGLPNLGAATFEIYDTFLGQMDQRKFNAITDQLRDLWSSAGQAHADSPPTETEPTSTGSVPDVAAWEASMTEAVWRADLSAHGGPEDAAPLALYSKLARSFRGSMLARALPRAIRYLLLRDGPGFEARMNAFFDAEDPKLYTPLEAAAFDQWLRENEGEIDPIALALLDYDMAFIHIVRQGNPQIVRFPGNPAPIFESLALAELPTLPDPPAWELEILPDSFTVDQFSAHAAGS